MRGASPDQVRNRGSAHHDASRVQHHLAPLHFHLVRRHPLMLVGVVQPHPALEVKNTHPCHGQRSTCPSILWAPVVKWTWHTDAPHWVQGTIRGATAAAPRCFRSFCTSIANVLRFSVLDLYCHYSTPLRVVVELSCCPCEHEAQ